MNQTLKIIKNIGWDLGFWVLSLFCEVPYYFVVGYFLHDQFFQDGKNFDLADNLLTSWLVWFMSTIYRAVSAHLIGSWVLKRFLLTRRVGPIIFGLSDFLLANLWIGIWAWLDPNGPTSILFHDDMDPQNAFKLTAIWFISIFPIALGSMTFRLVFKKAFDQRVGEGRPERSKHQEALC